MVASVSPLDTIKVTLWVCIPGRSLCALLCPVVQGTAFKATCPQAPFYHPPTSALTTSLSRILPEVSGLALSPLSARGTTCDCEKENSPGSHWSCCFKWATEQRTSALWDVEDSGRSLCGFHTLDTAEGKATLTGHWVWLFAFCVLLVSHVCTSSWP